MVSEGKSLHSEVRVLHPADSTQPHPSVMPEGGCWTFRPVLTSPIVDRNPMVPVIKFNAQSHICPDHGKANVSSFHFNDRTAAGHFSLSCGCAVNFERIAGKLKVPFSMTGDWKSWTFGGWRLHYHNLSIR